MTQYFVQHRFDDELCISIKTAREIINRVDMSDCSDEEMEVWESTEFGKLTKLTLHGCWHDPSNPLYIKATRPDGSIAFDGYGTDH